MSISKKNVQQRLLDVAEVIFAGKGFKAASIRQFASAAKCNLAAVNYYYGGKEKLYIEVWRCLLRDVRQMRIKSISDLMEKNDGKFSLEDLLTTFSYTFIRPFADEKRSERLMKLMHHEMAYQQLPANIFIDEVITPTMGIMQESLLRICPQLPPRRIPWLVFSLVGQLIHVIHMETMFAGADDMDSLGLDMTEALEHIVKFSAAGIRGFAKENS